MTRSVKRRPWAVILLLATAGLTSLAGAADAPPVKTLRLLAVGNSFSQNATTYLGKIATAAGQKLVLHQCAIGGGTLAQHWEKVTQLQADPADKRGRYTSGKTLQEELVAEKWDAVTIQQASIKSHDVTTYRPFAANLQAFIMQYAPGATLWLHQTWEYRVDDPRFAVPKPAPGEPKDQQAMYDMLTRSYETIATELGVKLIPVGDAFHAADSDPAWGYKPDTAFDRKTAAAPKLPDQKHSLHAGYKWAKGTDGKMTLGMDGHHASAAGQYLAALVWFETLYGQSVVGNSFRPDGMSAEDARYLQEVADRVVKARQ